MTDKDFIIKQTETLKAVLAELLKKSPPSDGDDENIKKLIKLIQQSEKLQSKLYGKEKK